VRPRGGLKLGASNAKQVLAAKRKKSERSKGGLTDEQLKRPAGGKNKEEIKSRGKGKAYKRPRLERT